MLPNMDKIIQLESQVVKLTFEISELKNTIQTGAIKRGKSNPPFWVNGAADSNSIKSFIVVFWKYYDLMTVSDPNQQARFTAIIMQENALT